MSQVFTSTMGVGQQKTPHPANNPLIVPPKPGQQGRPKGDDPYQKIDTRNRNFLESLIAFLGRFLSGVVELIEAATEAAKKIIKQLPEITENISNVLPLAVFVALLVLSEKAK